MKSAPLLLPPIAAMLASAAPPPAGETFYTGGARATELPNGAVTLEAVALRRRVEGPTTVEALCTRSRARPAIRSTLTIIRAGARVTADNGVRGDGRMEGAGTIDGARRSLALRLQLADGTLAIAEETEQRGDRIHILRRVTGADGAPVQRWEADLALTDPITFEARRRAMRCRT